MAVRRDRAGAGPRGRRAATPPATRAASNHASMERRVLGDGGPELPVVGMGTWRASNVHRVVDAALAAGANVFDSSPMYGAAEEELGAALADRREGAFVATKSWSPSAAEGRRQAERALGFYGG